MRKILAADIGGTNSRFAYFSWEESEGLCLIESKWLKTAAAGSFADLIGNLRAGGFGLPFEEADICVLAVAGPVEGGAYSRPPAIAWDIDLLRDREAIPRRCKLINDFAAQAFACRSPIMASAEQVLAGQVDMEAPLVVVGAGTGLGQAALVPVGCGRYAPVPSEGAHTAFPFTTEREFAYMRFLLEQVGGAYAIANTVVSGRGLSLVHQFLRGAKLEPAEVARRLTEDSPTLLWMARFYGRVCRHYALQTVSRGGVYIAGGVAAKVPRLVTHSAFAEEFRRSSTMGHLLAGIPVFLNRNQESGLWGAALAAVQDLRFGEARKCR